MTYYRNSFLFGACSSLLSIVGTMILAKVRNVAFGLPLDDAWIHSAFARNIGQNHIWGLIEGETSGGESSLLWPIILSFGEIGGFKFAPVLAVAFGAACYLLLPGIVGNLASTANRGRVTAIAVGFCGPLLFAALSGMETIPALTAGSMAILFAIKKRYLWAGVSIFFAVTLRPDSIVLVPLLIVSLLLRENDSTVQRENRKPLASLSILFGTFVVVFVVGALSILEHNFPPATLGGRRWIIGATEELDVFQFHLGFVSLVSSWITALYNDLGAGRLVSTSPLGELWKLLWYFLATILTVTGLVSTVRKNRNRDTHSSLVVLAWVLVIVGIYSLILPDRGHVGRYQPQVYVFFIIFVVEGFFHILQMKKAAKVALIAPVVLVSSGCLASLAESSWHWTTAVDHINKLHVFTSNNLRVDTPADATIAVFDIGAVAYDRPRAIVDISGLTGGDSAQALYDRNVEQYLIESNATHLLLPRWGGIEGEGSLRQRLGVLNPSKIELRRIKTYSYSDEGWLQQFQYTGNAFKYIDLYAISY